MAAKKFSHEPITSLSHHLDLNWMAAAYRKLRASAAPGVDDQTVADYGDNLTDNLRDLLGRVKGGCYQAPPVKRAYIPKNEKEDRPIGIPTVEDKLLQRAVTMVLEPIYEQEFLSFSFGFRPGRSQHQALENLRNECFGQRVNWILEVDLRRFFDTVDHRQVRELIGRRVQDGVISRLIAKWLKAGVWEGGNVCYPEEGTPQGGVISPLISNVYLHEVLDKWYVEAVQPACKGGSFMVRYADDFVMGFERREDALKVQRVLAKRCARFGLEINAEKTRLVPFGRPPFASPKVKAGKGPGSFDFLGFTHYWARSRQGNWVVKQKTARDRFRRALRKIREWGWENRHLRMKAQQDTLNAKLRGHDAYYGITSNYRMLSQLRREVTKAWRKWLVRRNRSNKPDWKQFGAMLQVFPLTPARVVHSRCNESAIPRNRMPELGSYGTVGGVVWS
jgi:RNA-directed DNA polymerase